jgi:Primase C terminal 1 (PriCT-1)/Bifunctional DNA primase/polymerase, N-terminal
MTPVATLRLQLRKAGYHPVPCDGKAIYMSGWKNKFDSSDDEIRLWDKVWHLARNTGVLAKFTPGLDIDIMDTAAADAVEALAREHFEERGNILVRFGLPPKRLVPLRTDEPFNKLVRVFTAPNGYTHKIEVLGSGQQWIALGIHPDTHRPYGWHGGELTTTPREDLPYVRAADMENFLDAAANLLVEEFNYTVAVEQPANGNGNGAIPPAKWRELVTAGVAEGNRDVQITRLTGYLLRRYVDPFVTLQLVASWNLTHCRPPLPSEDVARIVNSIAGRELRRRTNGNR